MISEMRLLDLPVALSQSVFDLSSNLISYLVNFSHIIVYFVIFYYFLFCF